MNIEKTISEHAVSDILTPMLESQDRIVTEDVAPLFDAATGLDTPPASGTVTTTIEESRNLITAIIRKAWTATLTMLCGASVIGYIVAAYTYLRNRLQGSETYGIPDRRSEISASSPLAANLALLNDRKIGGVPDATDGISLVGLVMGENRDNITEVTDNCDWSQAISAARFDAWKGMFPNLSKLTIGSRKELKYSLLGNCNIEEIIVCCDAINLTALSIDGGWGAAVCNSVDRNTTGFKKLSLPNCKTFKGGWVVSCYNSGLFAQLESVEMPELEIIYAGSIARTCNGSHAGMKLLYLPKLKRIEGGSLLNVTNSGCAKLIKIVVGAMETNLNLGNWNPSVALDASRTDLIEEGSTAQNNLQQFLSNFRSYIANRLTDNGSGKTLTLSQAVFSEIWDSQGQPQVKGDGLDQLRADIHRIIRTDKQWAVNKA